MPISKKEYGNSRFTSGPSKGRDGFISIETILSDIDVPVGTQTDLKSLAQVTGVSDGPFTPGLDLSMEDFIGTDLAFDATIIELSETSLSFNNSGNQTLYVTVSTNGVAGFTSIPSWLSVSPSFVGDGTTRVSFIAGENNLLGVEERSQDVIVFGAGSTQKTLSVTQAGNPATIEITPSPSISVTSLSGTTNIVVRLSTGISIGVPTLSNTSGFSVTETPTTSTSFGVTTYTYVVTRTSNTGGERQSDFSVGYTGDDGGVSGTLTTTIIQEAFAPEISLTSDLTPNVDEMLQTGETIEVTLASNTSWTLSVNQTGFSISKQPTSGFVNTLTGTGSDIIYFKAAENLGLDRTGYLIGDTTHNVSGLTEDRSTLAIRQDGLRNYVSGDITISFSVNDQGDVTSDVTTTGDIPFTATFSTGYDSNTNSYPLVDTDTNRTLTVSVEVPEGFANTGDTITNSKTVVQDGLPTLSTSDVVVGTTTAFAVAPNGDVTAPSVVVPSGITYTLFYSTGRGGTNPITPPFDFVTETTERYANVTVDVPTGYYNVGDTIVVRKFADQESFNPNITVSTTNIPNEFSILGETGDFLVSNVNYEWTATIINGTGIEMSLSPTSGFSTNDITRTIGDRVYVKMAKNTAGARTGQIKVFTNFGNLDDTYYVNLSQAGYADYTFGDWDGVVSINMYGVVSATQRNAGGVSFSPTSFGRLGSAGNRIVSVTLTAPSSGVGNPGEELSAQNVTVSQPKFVPSISVSSVTYDITRQGTNQNLTITSNSTWGFSSVASWVNLGSTTGGSSTGTSTSSETITIGGDAQVLGSAARSDVIRVTTSSNVGTNVYKDITVNQAAGVAATLSMSPNDNFDITKAGTGVAATITTNTNWVFSSVASWINLSRSSGTSSQGSITIGADAQVVGADERTDNITLSTNSPGGVNTSITGITVTQAKGTDATIGISDTTINVTHAGVGQDVDITSNTTWTFSSVASWINLSQTTGNGNVDGVTISADAQVVGTTSRADTVTLKTTSGTLFATKNFTVTQAGRAATIDVTPEPYEYSGAGNAKTFSVSSNTTWEVTSKPSWITIGTTTSNSFVATATGQSANADSRSGTIRVTTTSPGGNDVYDDVTVTQRRGEFIDLIGDSTIFAGGATNKQYTVNTSEDFSTAWTVTEDGNWVSRVSYTGTGDGTPTLTFQPNYYGGSNRTATITVAKNGSTTITDSITVSQGVMPQWARTPASLGWLYNETNVKSVSLSTTMTWRSVITGDFEHSKSSTSGFVQTDLTGTGADIIYVRPTGTTINARTGTLSLRETNSSYTFSNLNTGLSQEAKPPFTFSDWSGVVSVSTSGIVSATNGNATVISTDPESYVVSGTTYPDYVNTSTSRTITVEIEVPAGESNTGDILSGDKTVNQSAAETNLQIDMGGGSAFSTGTTNVSTTSHVAQTFTLRVWTLDLPYDIVTITENNTSWLDVSTTTTSDGSASDKVFRSKNSASKSTFYIVITENTTSNDRTADIDISSAYSANGYKIRITQEGAPGDTGGGDGGVVNPKAPPGGTA